MTSRLSPMDSNANPDQEPLRLYRALIALLEVAQRDPRLRAEIARAHREYFGPPAPVPSAEQDPQAQAIAATRFAEWYLLERESAVLGAVPLQALRAPLDESGLDGSVVGLFLAEDREPAERVRDLQAERSLELDTYGLLSLRAGDLLIGRLFPGDGGRWVPSAAVAVQRDAIEVARAFQRDYRSLQLARRLSQAELEQLWFLRRPAEPAEPPPPIERLEADLESLLVKAGKTQHSASAISAALSQALRPGPVMGPLLDELAFDTDVDLERAQRLLLLIWNHHHAQKRAPEAAAEPEPPPPPPRKFTPQAGETLGQTLARRIREGLENHEDIEELFEDVEGMLGDVPEEPDDPGGPDVEDGNLGALVEEYLWEAGQPEEREALERFVATQHDAPRPKDEIEYLETGDLLRFLLEIYLKSPPAQREPRVGATFRALESFYRWVERTQGYEVSAALAGCRVALIDELARVHRASQELGAIAAAPRRTSRPLLLRVHAVLPEGVEVVPVDEGEPCLVAAAGADLRAGDLVLAALEADRDGAGRLVGSVVVLPASAQPFLG